MERTMSNVAFSLTLVLPTKERYYSADLQVGVVFSIISPSISAVMERIISNAGLLWLSPQRHCASTSHPSHGGVIAITDGEHVERVATDDVVHHFVLRALQTSI